MIEPKEYIAQLQETSLYQQWTKLHPKSYLTHFFCQLSPLLEPLGMWEVGFFNPESDKITVFTTNEIKPEDEVFRKDSQQQVEELKLQQVSITIENATQLYRANWQRLFPKQVLGNGFCIMQVLEQRTIYNFTFITTSLVFINLKIDAQTGDITDHQTIQVLDKQGNRHGPS